MARQIIETPEQAPLCEHGKLPPDLQAALLAALGPQRVQRLQAWAQARADAALVNVFGYHALQLGWSGWQGLRHNRMPRRWLALHEHDGRVPQCPSYMAPLSCAPHDGLPHLAFDSRAWPLPPDALDLVLLPHTLERSADPRACLREVARVLVPEGQVCIVGLHPWGPWGWRWRRQLRKLGLAGPDAPQLIGPGQLREWLGVLGFEVQQLHALGGWPGADPLATGAGLARWGGAPWGAAAYVLLATKRVTGLRARPEARAWRTRRTWAARAVPAARSS